MNELLNLGASVCTGLIFGASFALLISMGAVGWAFEQGRRAGRNAERARWEYIWPADERIMRPYDNPVDEALHELGIQP